MAKRGDGKVVELSESARVPVRTVYRWVKTRPELVALLEDGLRYRKVVSEVRHGAV